jgi:hypothetical protein
VNTWWQVRESRTDVAVANGCGDRDGDGDGKRVEQTSSPIADDTRSPCVQIEAMSGDRLLWQWHDGEAADLGGKAAAHDGAVKAVVGSVGK